MLKHDIPGLQVAVNDAPKVHGVHGQGYFANEGACLIRFHAQPVSAKSPVKHFSLNQAHHQKRVITRVHHIINGTNVRVANLSNSHSFNAKSTLFSLGQPWLHHFNSHFSAKKAIKGFENHPHATRPDLPHHLESAAKTCFSSIFSPVTNDSSLTPQ
jgi:hypothetical protein